MQFIRENHRLHDHDDLYMGMNIHREIYVFQEKAS